MDFTFGIITGGNNETMVNEIIDSIEKLSIPNYEIVIVGSCNIDRNNTKLIPFNENIKSKWITKKKNLITQNVKYENIVYMHDYIKFSEDWYEGHLNSGEDFKVRMDRITTREGRRFRDWCIWPKNGNFMDTLIGRKCLLPYDMTHLSKYMYISGSYWVAKKSVMLEFPLNENLVWGQGEDVLWSKQIREKYKFSMNPHSEVKIMKPNKNIVFELADETIIKKLKEVV